jgi:FkbM family methyltransferase
MAPADLLDRAHLWYAGQGPRRLAFAYARLHPSVESLERLDDCWRLEMDRWTVFLSDPRQITRFVGLGTEMDGRVGDKYTLSGFVEVEDGDTVVDVGAFIGEFAMFAGGVGSRVVAVEPDERNAAALRHNLEDVTDGQVVNKAVWRETGERSFQVATDPSESSILEVDTDDVTDVVSLETVRIDELARDVGLDRIDYLKLEAEGAEPEALEGIGDLDVPKLAVECAPERDGESPVGAVTRWLEDRGYAVRADDHIVFARR